jgi:hypothetical protein
MPSKTKKPQPIAGYDPLTEIHKIIVDQYLCTTTGPEYWYTQRMWDDRSGMSGSGGVDTTVLTQVWWRAKSKQGTDDIHMEQWEHHPRHPGPPKPFKHWGAWSWATDDHARAVWTSVVKDGSRRIIPKEK